MPRQQKQPRQLYTTIQSGLLAEASHLIPVLDLMSTAGYSRTRARELIRNGHVWTTDGNEWRRAEKYASVDFLDSPFASYVLVVQSKPYLEGWHASSRVINVRARPTTLLDWIRMRLGRFWPPLYPYMGTLEVE